ncbi:hypothetical protein F4804DRAFT_346592 [Jackrogersella minutella]|nr:hypothetical protein F4804DRAFT_346592 [Jackrogersella minutella]
MRVDLSLLGRSSSYYPEINVTCHEFGPGSDRSIVYLIVTGGMSPPAFYPLSTFHTTIHLIGPDSAEKGCLEANVTPGIGSAIQEGLRYAPLGILIFVLLVGTARSISLNGPTPKDAPSTRAMLPGFADCLQYLQFIFFTGTLSLFYPGFYQPVVSRLGWLSLFADRLVTHGQTYPGVKDGIYEINGTYGGTFGLEIMTQITGAPMTMDTWLNMVILIMAIATLSALCLGTYSHWNRSSPSDPDSNSDTGLRRTFIRTIRVVLSYFMLPLIALSFYQLDNVGHLPTYHITLAIILIVSILVAFIWLLTSIPTRSLGVLIFESRKRYRQISPSSGDQHKTFVLALFVLCFIRGVAVGGLQISGRAQLAVLGACELLLLACIMQFQAYSMLSVGTISAVVRLGSLLCMVVFVPGVVSDNVRNAVGYAVIILHASMLILGFFVPAVVQLAKICTLWWSTPGPDVYNLRKLRRRRVSRNHLPDRTHASSSPSNSNIDQESPAHSELADDPLDDANTHHSLNSSTISNRDYYRPARHSRIMASHSMDWQHRQNMKKEPTASPDVSVDGISSGRLTSSIDRIGSLESARSAPIHLEAPTSTTGSASASASLHPRWADYSFRESDLFYGAPNHTPTESSSTAETPESPASRHTMRPLSPLNIWRRVSGQRSTEEQGFSVVRPPRPSNLPPA